VSKKNSEKNTALPRRVNVEIAPANKERLFAYLRAFNENPDRRYPALNLTDALNAALDEFLTEELVRLQPAPVLSESAKTRMPKAPVKKEE
jgi:hypothetical protein